jgi:hypothetical protein
MQNKRTEPHGYSAHLPALWKFLLSYRRTVVFILSGAVISLIAGAIRFHWQASPSPLLHTRQQPKDLSASVLNLSSKAVVIDPITKAVTLEAIDSQHQRD